MATNWSIDDLKQLSPESIRQLVRKAQERTNSVAPSLERHPGRKEYPLSFEQERLWFLDQFLPGALAYNWPVAVEVFGELDPEMWQKAIDLLVSRHEILRTVYVVRKDEPVQIVKDRMPVKLQLSELNTTLEERWRAEVKAIVMAENRIAFDLSAGPLLRCGLIRLPGVRSAPWFIFHHSIVDGWSAGVIVEELSAIIRRLSSGESLDVPALPIQYGDYAVWQRQRFSADMGARLRAYWLERLKDLPRLDFPTDFRRPADLTTEGGTSWISLPDVLASRLDRAAKSQNVTLFTVMLAAFQTLLMRYTGASDIPVAIPVSNRAHPATEKLIGFFVNTVVIRGDLSREPNFAELLRRTAALCREALSHQEMPFGELVRIVNPARDFSRSPLTQIAFQVEELAPSVTSVAGSRSLDIDLQSVFFDLDFHFLVTRNGGECQIRGMVTYSTALFREQTIRRLCEHYEKVLGALSAAPEDSISRVDLIPDRELRIIEEWSGAARHSGKPPLIMERFAIAAQKYANATAVKCGEECLTYREVDAASDRLCSVLVECDIDAGDVVAIHSGRSVQTVVAILGVMKSGATYCVVDPDLPMKRRRLMIENSGAAVVINTSHVDPLHMHGVISIRMEGAAEYFAGERGIRPSGREDPLPPSMHHYAYLIYTSGSSGQPKGVRVTHGSIASYASSVIEKLEADRRMNYGLVSSLAVDLGYTVLFVSLCTGGCLNIATESTLQEPEAFRSWMLQSEIDCLKITPSYFGALYNGLRPDTMIPRLFLIFGGEPLSRELIRQIFQSRPACRVFNHYGPTECTVGVAMYECTSRDDPTVSSTVPLGKPLQSARLYVLDTHANRVPALVTGELYVAGDGVAQGYFSPALTAQRFLADPFTNEPGRRMYRTGDLVRWLPDGNLEFLGRADGQVKVRGYRVEISEIEEAIRSLQGVREAVVVSVAYEFENRLVAYVMCDPSQTVTDKQLREGLSRVLPKYMIPSAWRFLDTFPRTPSGKIDRRQLPAEEAGSSAVARIAPRNETEHFLASLWESLLNRRSVGVTEDFFGLGGHSLLAVRLMSALNRRYGVNLPVSALFQAGTIQDLAALISGKQALDDSPLVPLRASQNGPVLFLMHPAGGDVYCYQELTSHLKVECTVYGLQDNQDGSDAYSDTIEAMAHRYLNAMRSVQRYGPYYLAGWSMGGLIGYEIARQLELAQEKVAFLGIIDMAVPQPSDPVSMSDVRRLLDLGFRLGEYAGADPRLSEETLKELSPEDRLKLFSVRMKEMRLIPADIEDDFWIRFVRSYERHTGCVSAYNLKSYAGDIYFFKSMNLPRFKTSEAIPAEGDRRLLWQSYCSGQVVFKSVPGSHMSIMRPPEVDVLAAELSDAVARCATARP